MIRKLRIKFIAIAMLSLIGVLGIIMAFVNILNYKSVISEADQTLELLLRNDGKFPILKEQPAMYPGQKALPRQDFSLFPGQQRALSPELPYESRFFSALLDNNGTILSIDTEHIAAVDDENIKEWTNEIFQSERTSGFQGNYRYMVNETPNGIRIIFLDCTRTLSTFRTFLFFSCGISLLGIAAVFVLITLMSGRIIKPISESYEKQKQFITDAGHELKTPLTVIDADAEMLDMELELNNQNEWLTDIRSQTKRLASLTNDLIYLSRMEEGMKLQTMEFPLSDLVIETALSFQALAKSQRKELAIDAQPGISFEGDEKALRQLLSILLDNALKYSPQDGTITVFLEKKGKSICLSIKNQTLEPIDRNCLSHLFDRFYRVETSRNSDAGGYGIGLSIARAVVTAHKGKIAAVSEEEGTLIMQVTLPG